MDTLGKRLDKPLKLAICVTRAFSKADPDPSMFVLAHLTDPHLGPLPTPQWTELVGKRAAGFLNWRRKRHRIHRGDVLARIVADHIGCEWFAKRMIVASGRGASSLTESESRD
jgi:hypothetical protein